MFASLLILAATSVSQYGYGYGYYQQPLPVYNPAGYHRRYPEYIFPYVSGVGNPKTIELPGVEEVGRIEKIDVKASMLTVRLPTEVVYVHYGPKTYITGSFAELRPGTVISINEVKRRITILGDRKD